LTHLDTDRPSLLNMIAVMAQCEKKEISEKVAATSSVRAKLKKPQGGQATFGYEWRNGQLVPNRKEAPIRKLIYELFLEHKRKKTVAHLLNEAGYRTRKGAKFSDTTVGRLLRDPTPKGIRWANRTKSLGAGKKWVPKPKEKWIQVKVEPIVSEEVWDKCNRILDEQEIANRKPARKTINLFSGLTYCHCGHKMYVPSNSPKYVCRKCRNKIGVNDLEDLFLNELQSLSYAPSDLTAIFSKTDKEIQEKERLLKALIEEQRTLKKEKTSLTEDDSILKDRLLQIEQQIPDFQSEIDFLKIQHLRDSKDLNSQWSDLPDSKKRKIIEAVVEKIVIGSDMVTINLAHI